MFGGPIQRMRHAGSDPGETEKHPKTRWEQDGSTGVLVNYLKVPGNYKHWRDGYRKVGGKRHEVVGSIAAELKMQGKWRSESGIRGKINLLEGHYEHLFEWLHKNSIAVDDVLNGPADGALQMRIKAKYPHYRELMPVFQPYSKPSDSSADTESTRSLGTKRKLKAANQNDLAPKRRRRAAPSSAASVDVAHGTETDAQSGEATDAAPHSVFGRSVTYGFQYSGNGPSAQSWRYDRYAVIAQQPVANSPEVQRRLADIMVNHAERRSDLHLKAEEREENLRFKTREVEAVHQLKRAGVPDDIMNRHFLPQGG